MTEAVLDMNQGNDCDLIFNVVDRAGDPVVISGITAATYALGSDTYDEAPVITKTLGAGVTIQSATSIKVEISKAENQNLRGTYHHELKITDASGKEVTIYSKAISVNKTLIT